ncbi:hypothetical protein D3C81_2243220 [compost metagenome]
MAVSTLTGDGFKIEHKLTFRVAIAGMEHLAKARFALQQLTLATLRAGDAGFIRFVDHFGMIAVGIVAATDKHAITPLA